MDWVKGSQRKLAEGYRRHPLLFPSLPGFTALVDPSPAACRGNSTKLLRRNGVERISLRFSFRNHPDRALRGNSLPRLPRQKAYQPLRLCHGQSAAGTGIRPPARSYVFLVTTLLKALIITLITGFSDGWQKKQQAALSFPDGWFTESGICCSLWQRHSDCCDRQGGKVIYTYFPCITLPPCTACLYVICPVPFPGGRSFSAAQACPLRRPPSTSFH